MFKQAINILECSRVFSLPMTILSWLVVFVYSLIDSGNLLYGIVSLIGLAFAHLGTNVLDDYFDYKSLIKQVNFDKEEYLKNSQKTKCRYLINGVLKEGDVLLVASAHFFIALLCGCFLYFKCGIGVVYFALAGAIIAALYSIVSRFCLSEAAVALAYGPALFGGVYYVMCGTYSRDVFLLCLPTMFMTVVLLYIHTVMDYEFDLHEGKKTIANSFNSRLDALIVLKILLIAAYISPILLCVFDILDWQVFLVYLTIPLAVDLYKSMVDYSVNPESIPVHKWFHFPMEDMNGAPAFMTRMFQSRNLMIYFSILFSIAIIASLLF